MVHVAGKSFTSTAEATDPTTLWKVDSMAFGGDGLLYFVEDYQGLRAVKLRRVEPSFPGRALSASAYQLPSPDGNSVLHFDDTGRLLDVRQTGSDDLLYTFTYTQELLTGVTDRYGNSTLINRDPNGQLQQIVAPFGQTTRIGVDVRGRITNVNAPDGTAYRFTYSGTTSLFETVINPRSAATGYSFDADGKLVSEEDAVGGGKTIDWASATQPIVTTADGVTTSFGFTREPTGLVRTAQVLPDEPAATSTESSTGVSTLTKVDGTQTDTTLQADPIWGMARPYVSRTVVTLPSGLASTTTTTRTATPVDSNVRFGANDWTETTTVNGRPQTRSYNASTRTLTVSSPEGRLSTTTLNSAGSVKQEAAPGRATKTTTFDAKGRPLTISQTDGTTSRTFSYGYDLTSGYLSTVTGPISTQTSVSTTDVFGRAITEQRPDGATTAYGFDQLGQLSFVTPAGKQSHFMDRDPVDLLQAYTAANSSTPARSYTYTLDRNTKRMLTASGQAADFVYRTDGKLDKLTTSWGTAEYSYDNTTGQLAQILDVDGGQLSLHYDGSLIKELFWGGSADRVHGTVGMNYDANFWLKDLTVNGEVVASYTRDNDGLVTSASALSITRDLQSGDVSGTLLGAVATAHETNRFGEQDRGDVWNKRAIRRADCTARCGWTHTR